MTQHIHAALIKIWADNRDTQFEWRSHNTEWQPVSGAPMWNRNVEYRVQPGPDPHAEVKAAFAAGAKIQYYEGGICREWKDIESPSWLGNVKYRVKPEPICRWVPLFLMPAGAIVVGNGLAERKAAISSNWNGKSPSETLHAILAMEFDPETKALISCVQEAP